MRYKKLFFGIILLIILCFVIFRLNFFKDQANYKNYNIILLTFDALRADHLGCYGYNKTTSINIDNFAKKSSVFLKAFSQCGTTTPSLLSLFTSKYPYSDHILEKKLALGSDETTLTEIIQKNGYETIGVVGQKYAKSEFGLSRGFNIFDQEFTPPESAYNTRLKIVKYLSKISKKPFFLWAHFRPPHSPYNPSRETFNKFYNGEDGLSFYSENLDSDYKNPYKLWPKLYNNHKILLNHYAKKEVTREYIIYGTKLFLTDTIIKQLISMYDGCIFEMDREFGILMNDLKKLNLLDNTIIIIASDHGESLGEFDIFDHNNLYYGIIHTPLIVYVPGKKHKILDSPVMNVDIFPTILEMLGLKYEVKIRGENLFNKKREKDFLFSEYSHFQSVIKGPYQVITNHPKFDNVLLFDIFLDPNNKLQMYKNSYIFEYYLKILKEIKRKPLTKKLKKYKNTFEELKTLGYIDSGVKIKKANK